MIDHGSHDDDLQAYGEWPWVVGALFAAALIGVLFALAKGFS